MSLWYRSTLSDRHSLSALMTQLDKLKQMVVI